MKTGDCGSEQIYERRGRPSPIRTIDRRRGSSRSGRSCGEGGGGAGRQVVVRSPVFFVLSVSRSGVSGLEAEASRRRSRGVFGKSDCFGGQCEMNARCFLRVCEMRVRVSGADEDAQMGRCVDENE